jgi:hypothetical protein
MPDPAKKPSIVDASCLSHIRQDRYRQPTRSLRQHTFSAVVAAITRAVRVLSGCLITVINSIDPVATLSCQNGRWNAGVRAAIQRLITGVSGATVRRDAMGPETRHVTTSQNKERCGRMVDRASRGQECKLDEQWCHLQSLGIRD